VQIISYEVLIATNCMNIYEQLCYSVVLLHVSAHDSCLQEELRYKRKHFDISVFKDVHKFIYK
jgi:hypothetical protein